jgi:hypothetical protein
LQKEFKKYKLRIEQILPTEGPGEAVVLLFLFNFSFVASLKAFSLSLATRVHSAISVVICCTCTLLFFTELCGIAMFSKSKNDFPAFSDPKTIVAGVKPVLGLMVVFRTFAQI